MKPTPGLLKAARVFEFAENELWIRTKRAREFYDKAGQLQVGQLVPFWFNAVQVMLAQDMARSWHEGKPWKRLLPKARQHGVSTWGQGITYSICQNQSDYISVLVAHTERNAEEIFETTQYFDKNLDPELALDLLSKQAGKLVWDNRSSMWMGTVKATDALGKGPRLSALHLSEAANFADQGIDAVNTITSILNAVADSPDAVVLYESTAKGRDPFFYEECQRALDPKAGTENKVIFLPWFMDPEYSMTWEEYKARLDDRKLPSKFTPKEDERLLRSRLASAVVTKENYRYTYNVKLTDEQLIWRRFKIANDCFDKVALFQRYYPSFLEEAFTSTTQCLFTSETINHYARNKKRAIHVCDLVDLGSRVAMQARKGAPVRVWVEPESGEDYVIGADVGGERKGSDPCAAYVLNRDTLEVVAAVHGHMEYDTYATLLCALGRLYNNALLMVENNHNPATAKVCFQQQYPNLYHYQDEASTRARVAPKPGWNTNRKTRPEILAYLDKVTRTRELRCPDAKFAKEMESFAWVEKDKTYKATGKNHDDRIMALAIALYACPGVAEHQEEEIVRTESWAYRRFLQLAEIEDAEVVRGVWML